MAFYPAQRQATVATVDPPSPAARRPTPATTAASTGRARPRPAHPDLDGWIVFSPEDDVVSAGTGLTATITSISNLTSGSIVDDNATSTAPPAGLADIPTPSLPLPALATPTDAPSPPRPLLQPEQARLASRSSRETGVDSDDVDSLDQDLTAFPDLCRKFTFRSFPTDRRSARPSGRLGLALHSADRLGAGSSPAQERNARIERWRLDLVDHIDRSSRLLPRSRPRQDHDDLPVGQETDCLPPHNSVDITKNLTVSPPKAVADSSDPSAWNSLSRAFIRSVLGFDPAPAEADLFGPVSTTAARPRPSGLAGRLPPISLSSPSSRPQSPGRSSKFVTRIARELGVLMVDGLSSEHGPYPFSTYSSAGSSAGPLPKPSVAVSCNVGRHKSVPTSPRFESGPTTVNRAHGLVGQSDRKRRDRQVGLDGAVSDRLFVPTVPAALGQAAQTRPLSTRYRGSDLWGVDNTNLFDYANPTNASRRARERRSATTKPTPATAPVSPTHPTAECAYWEQELNVSKVIGYICTRFSSSRPPSRHGPVPETDEVRNDLVDADYPGDGRESGRHEQAKVSIQPSQSDDSLTSLAASRHRAAVIRALHPLSSQSSGMGTPSRSTSMQRRQTYPFDAPLTIRVGNAEVGSRIGTEGVASLVSLSSSPSSVYWGARVPSESELIA